MSCRQCRKSKSLSVSDMARGAVKILKSEMGIGIVDEESIKARRALCEACDMWDHGRCTKCGCFTYAKTRLTHERCPLGKWSEP